ncbi:MAG: radical SAM protein [Flavobacteriales bacterium]|nr:radical SAM protein [Flavobacteriales bacterium]
MKILRSIDTICPFCLTEMPGSLIQKEDRIVLHRDCPEHGVFEKTISHHPESYADLDRFFFKVLKQGETKGEITNYWVMATNKCNTNCSYCSAEMQEPSFARMDKSDFDKIIKENKKIKLTLAGGEPTVHPDMFYFIEEAVKNNCNVQLATNGIKLNNTEFTKKLKSAGLSEIRLSFEMLKEDYPVSPELKRWTRLKLKALENLEKENLPVSLSPTIFKGVNEGLIKETLDYAKDHPFVKEISVNGFSWVGDGTELNKEEMIMPDEMMDVICKAYNVQNRDSVFIMQKAMYTILQLLNIRICLYAQLMIFIRKNGELELFTDYFNMKRMKSGMKFWEKMSTKSYPVQFISFFMVMIYSIKPRMFLLAKDLLKFLINKFSSVNFGSNPEVILPLVLNTNCSTLTLDGELSLQCMSGLLMKKNESPNVISKDASSNVIIENQKKYFKRKSIA